jgi:hypothetical protein
MDNNIIELIQSKEDYHCLTCGSDAGKIKVRIQRINPVDCITSFHICDQCLAKMQKDIQKIRD